MIEKIIRQRLVTVNDEPTIRNAIAPKATCTCTRKLGAGRESLERRGLHCGWMFHSHTPVENRVRGKLPLRNRPNVAGVEWEREGCIG